MKQRINLKFKQSTWIKYIFFVVIGSSAIAADINEFEIYPVKEEPLDERSALITRADIKKHIAEINPPEKRGMLNDCLAWAISFHDWVNWQREKPELPDPKISQLENITIITNHESGKVQAVITDDPTATSIAPSLISDYSSVEGMSSWLESKPTFIIKKRKELKEYINSLPRKTLKENNYVTGMLYLEPKKQNAKGHFLNFYAYKFNGKEYTYIVDMQVNRVKRIRAFIEDESSKYKDHVFVWHAGSNEAVFSAFEDDAEIKDEPDTEEQSEKRKPKKGHLKDKASSKTGKSFNGEKDIKCTAPGCEKVFSTEGDRNVHVKRVHGDKNIECGFPGCVKAFTTMGLRNAHFRASHAEKDIKCGFEGCNKSFATATEQKKHIQETHEKPFKCSQCNRRFGNKNNLKNHELVHNEKFCCDVEGCAKSFETEKNLNEHQYEHQLWDLSEELPYKCHLETCPKRFKTLKQLIRHRETHDKKHQCTFNECTMAFSNSSHLKEHLKTHEEQAFKCNFNGCTRSFRYPKNRKEHMETHEEQAFKCNFNGCTRSFGNSKGLKEHMETHEEKAFKCSFNTRCKKKFATEDELQKHHDDHAKLMVPCPECGKLIGKKHLQRHINTHNR